jgi:ribonucleoside-diphosphate reductase alpha chain
MTQLSDNAITVLEKRYLLRDNEGNIIESPDDMFKRVAYHITKAEDNYNTSQEDKAEIEQLFYEAMSELRFLPNSPTLMNAGCRFNQLSACFVVPIEDSMESIFDAIKNAALVNKSGGGCIAKGSNVVTVNGVKKIEDVKIGDTVYCVNEKDSTFTQSKVKATHIYDSKDKNILKIILEANSEVITTDWHPFAVLTDKGIEYKRADHLSLNDLVISGEAYNIKKFSNYYWLLGLIISDGAFDSTKNGTRLRILKSNEDVIHRAADCIGIKYRKANDKRYQTDTWEMTKCGSYVDNEFSHLFKSNNKWKKAKIAFIPKDVFSAAYYERASFVAGLFDGDASYNKEKGRIDYVTVSYKLANDLQCLLSTLGIESNRRKRRYKQKNWNDIYEIQIKCYPGILEDIIKNTCRYNHEDIRWAGFNGIKFPKKFKEYLPYKGKEYQKPVFILGKSINLHQYYCSGILSKSSAITVLNNVLSDCGIWKIWKKYLPGAKKVTSISTYDKPITLHDLTVENSKTYLAGTKGSPVIIHNTGFSFSKIRHKNSPVNSTNGIASGPVSFIKVFNTATEQVKQGGVRRGANMAVLRVDHPDIMEFITCKRDSEEFNNFNFSVGVTDEFMNAVLSKSDFDLIAPHTREVIETIPALDIYNAIIDNAWYNGEPGIIFLDEFNRHNPTPNIPIEATNPCGEAGLLSWEACNLGSINLSKFISHLEDEVFLEYDSLKETVWTAIRFLDNVIDMSEFPLPQITEMVRKNRKVGLGVMGFADILYALKIPYNSKEALKLAEDIMSFIHCEAWKASAALGNERGVFPNYENSIYNYYDAPKYRNAITTIIAPTGSLSMIANCSSGIEPLFGLAYIKNVMDGEKLLMVNEQFEQVAKERGFYSKELMEKIARKGSLQNIEDIPDDIKKIFVISHDIEPEYHVKMQAAFQKYTDNAVSKTCNMPNNTTKEDIDRIYRLAYESHCKGITVYRDGSRDKQVLSFDKKQCESISVTPKERPQTLPGYTTNIKTGMGDLYVTVSELNGHPFEVFATIGKSGKSVTAKTEAIGRLISLALRSGIPVDKIINQLKGIIGEYPIFSDGRLIQSIPDAISYILSEKYCIESDGNECTLTKTKCPECGENIVFEENCYKCYSCGYSKCG